MNYHQPRQIQDGPLAGKWHYTVMNDGQIWPEGYCSKFRECPDCHGGSVFASDPALACSTCSNAGVIEVEPCPGHDTKQGAYEHQTQYLLDNKLRLDGQYANAQYHCEICQAWTDRFAEIDDRPYTLCDEHRTREVVTELFGTVGDSVSSY